MELRPLLIAFLMMMTSVAGADQAADYKKKLEKAYEKNRKKIEKFIPAKKKPQRKAAPVARPTPKPAPVQTRKPAPTVKPTTAPQALPTANPTAAPKPTTALTPVTPTTADDTIRQSWQKFPKSKNACKSGLYAQTLSPNFFDFSGRFTGCFAASLISPSMFQKIIGKPVFVSGPHKDDNFNFFSGTAFGHYNKEVVQWVLDHGIPGANDATFKSATQSVYENYLKRNVENFLATIYGLEANPPIFEQLQQKYTAAMKAPDGGLQSPENLLYFNLKGLPSDASNTLVVAFWIRRKIDGTAPLMRQVLEKIMNTYDPGGLARVKQKAASKPR